MMAGPYAMPRTHTLVAAVEQKLNQINCATEVHSIERIVVILAGVSDDPCCETDDCGHSRSPQKGEMSMFV